MDQLANVNTIQNNNRICMHKLTSRAFKVGISRYCGKIHVSSVGKKSCPYLRAYEVSSQFENSIVRVKSSLKIPVKYPLLST